MRKVKYCLIVGYGWSGSSAVVDLLKEFDSCYEPNIEFRVIKDPYGLYDLYRNVIEKWDPLNSDIAIKDFIWHMKRLYHKSNRFSLMTGLNYKTFFGENFITATDKFICNIVDFDYEGTWWFFDFKRSPKDILSRKIKRKLGGKTPDRMYHAHLSECDFLQYAREYIDGLFEPLLLHQEKKTNIILDQAVSLSRFQQEMKFFNDCKMIVVDRDPRDIYADLMNGENLIGKELKISHDCDKYIHFHQAMRHNQELIKNDPNVLCLQFEDLVLKYDECIQKIMAFLDLDHADHVYKREYFNPDISKKNIGIWKACLSEHEQRKLETDLKEYLVQ